MKIKRDIIKVAHDDTVDGVRAEKTIYKEGIAGGVAGAAVGGLTASIGHFAGRVSKNPKNKHLRKISEESLRKTKGIGTGVAIAGAGLATASALGYAKAKRKLKKLEEEKGNVNSEKE